MKRSIFFLSLLGLAAVACNNEAPAVGDAEGTAAAASELKASDFVPSKAEIDSVSYLLGVNFGSFLKNYNFGEDLNYGQIVKGMKDYVASTGDFRDPSFASQFKYDPQSINNAFNAFLGKRQNYLAAVNKEAGEKFLTENASKEGVKVTESGLQYKVLEPGSDVIPGPKDTVWVRYKGTLLDGTVFDQTAEDADSVRLTLDRVIKGWQEGMQLVGEGGKIELYVPAELGYGERGAGSTIGPNSTLIFDVELTRVAKFVEPEAKDAK